MNVIKALAHPARISILKLLKNGECCVCHLETYINMRQSYISQHLAVLKKAGLIKDRKDGWNVMYRLKNDDIFNAISILESMSVSSIDMPMVPTKICPCPNCTKNTNVLSNN